MSDYRELVLVITGSVNDWTIMDHCCETLADLEIAHSKVVASAHRQPARLQIEVKQFLDQGGMVFVCAAGMAAHLAGVVASQTTKPVVGVPLPGGVSGGMDALLSMPRGVPVATMAVGKHGAINAAIFAAQIIALQDEVVAEALSAYKAKLAE